MSAIIRGTRIGYLVEDPVTHTVLQFYNITQAITACRVNGWNFTLALPEWDCSTLFGNNGWLIG